MRFKLVGLLAASGLLLGTAISSVQAQWFGVPTNPGPQPQATCKTPAVLERIAYLDWEIRDTSPHVKDFPDVRSLVQKDARELQALGGLPSCKTETLLLTDPFFNNALRFGLGATVVLPNANVSWGGPGAGGYVSTTFNNAQFMPTLEITIPIFNTNVFGAPVMFSVENNFMIPTGGTQTSNVVQGGFPGSLGFQQSFINTAFLNATVAMGPSAVYDPAANRWYVTGGIGVAVDQTKTSATFPGAGDFFSSTNTDVMPAFRFGASFPFQNGAQLEVLFQDILPGPDHRFAVNGPSDAHYKVGNVVAFTGKFTMPFSFLGGAR